MARITTSRTVTWLLVQFSVSCASKWAIWRLRHGKWNSAGFPLDSLLDFFRVFRWISAGFLLDFCWMGLPDFCLISAWPGPFYDKSAQPLCSGSALGPMGINAIVSIVLAWSLSECLCGSSERACAPWIEPNAEFKCDWCGGYGSARPGSRWMQN